ncbi:alpha-ribazole phosphatase [Myroides sp. LJL115]
MEVYVIRHTPVEVAKGVCYGQSDLSLRKDFKQKALEYRKQLPKEFCQVYSSGLLRCDTLAREFSSSIVVKDSLKEMNFGKWENKAWTQIDAKEIDPWYKDFVTTKVPEGESFLELYQRVSLFLEDLRKQSHKRVLIVTHSGVMRSMWCYLLGIALENAFKIPIEYGDILRFDLGLSASMDKLYLKGANKESIL